MNEKDNIMIAGIVAGSVIGLITMGFVVKSIQHYLERKEAEDIEMEDIRDCIIISKSLDMLQNELDASYKNKKTPSEKVYDAKIESNRGKFMETTL